MNAPPQATGKQRYTEHYRWLVVGVGAALFISSILRLPAETIDLRFLLIASVTVVISSRLVVQIPRFDTNVTVSDTFIFLTILLYGGEPAILLATVEGIFGGLRISKSKKPLTILFNAAAMTCSTFVTVWTLRIGFGGIIDLPHHVNAVMITAVGTMALVQYISHTGLVAVALAYKIDQPVWHTWSKNYLWSSLTYFAGAAAAGLIVMSNDTVGFYGFMVAIAIIFILYHTYSKYLEDIKATAAQAERAERERAEQAEGHVQELNRYITELKLAGKALQESKEHFRHAAFHDPLTGLPNRALFADHVRRAVERTKRHGDYLFAVLFLDLDRFKYVNDSLGHTYGDKLLVATARRLETCLRQVDTVARFGGDEFAILLDGIKDSDDAVRVADRIQQELSVPFDLEKNEAFTTVSIGVALSGTGYEDPEDVLRDADAAMYHAKEGGKARYEVFDKAMHARAMARLRLERDLRRAVERQEFYNAYQPIVNLGTGKLVGFEALARWRHPERGVVSPAEFIPLSEETGLIVPVGFWILEEACRQMREWQRLTPANRMLTISVNLSAKQLAQPDLIGRVKEILSKTGLAPRCLKLEITESVVMENDEAAAAMLNQLRALGIELSMDDFGTGYSSLSYLHRFPVSTLKVDRSFVSRMSDKGNTEIVRTIVMMAQNLGMDVVAEGIETEEQLTQLKIMGCENGQGYYFSKPIDAEAASRLLSDGPEYLPAPLYLAKVNPLQPSCAV